MNQQIDLRQEILRRSHQWPIILLTFFAGALIGLAVAVLLPGNYRAETRLNVTYNADAIFRNPDDFKNWEMEQLNLIVFSEPVLQQTLSHLQETDPFWKNTTEKELLSDLRVYWRNVGTWRLVGYSRSFQHAEELVNAWQEVILDTLDQASQHASKLTELNYQLSTSHRQHSELSMRLVELEQIKQALQTWKKVPGQVDDLNVSESTRWYLFSLAARLIQLNPAGQQVLVEMPEAGKPSSLYDPWIDKLIILIDNQVGSIDQQFLELEKTISKLTQSWNQTYLESLGLSSYIHVEAIDGLEIDAQPVKSIPLFVLSGGMIGLLVCVLVWLVLPFLQEVK